LLPSSFGTIKDYTLVICEKPDSAKRVFEALKGESKGKVVSVWGIPVYIAENSDKTYVICSAVGHLYGLNDVCKRKSIYPVFDIDWFQKDSIDKSLLHVKNRIRAIEVLAEHATDFVEATDFDIEGETIGYNILKYACKGKHDLAKRAKFSTLTPLEITESFRNSTRGLGRNLAKAGRTRHVVDFIWGVNLSRLLSQSVYSATATYKTLSIGRVQGPTLAFVVQRETEIRTFVPIPYWSVGAVFGFDGKNVFAPYEQERVETLLETQKIKQACEGKTGHVSRVERNTYEQIPPTPFNLGDLQREAFRVFHFSPSQTLGVAEKLYLQALISYPRTSSQKLPQRIGYRRIIEDLRSIARFRELADELLTNPLKPHEGGGEDPAHPAIYPTGERPRRQLQPGESKLLDLIIHRFFAVFGENAVIEKVATKIDVEGFMFNLKGKKTIAPGWMRYYHPYIDAKDLLLPRLIEGQPAAVIKVEVKERIEKPPFRYNQSSLLEKMEKEEIGTKATRADIIGTLFERGYVYGESITATEVGFSLIEKMTEHLPDIISTNLTREIENDLEKISEGQGDDTLVVEKAIDKISGAVARLRGEMNSIGQDIHKAVEDTRREQSVLGRCPVCATGNLLILKSKMSGKRFVGCSNYRRGCRASAPLPQMGFIKIPKEECLSCHWPILYVKRLSRFPWRLCINPSCPSKVFKRKKPSR
jgi:DNA topoisomerase-1